VIAGSAFSYFLLLQAMFLIHLTISIQYSSRWSCSTKYAITLSVTIIYQLVLVIKWIN